MNVRVVATMGVLVVFLASLSQAAPVESRFDTDSEGWTAMGDVHGETWLGTNGNPPGCFKAIDDATGDTWFFVAPPKFLGDQSNAYGHEIGYDLWISARDANILSYPWISLVGDGIELGWVGAYPDAGQWTHFETVLTPTGGWMVGSSPATEAQIWQVLSNLTAMRFCGEYLTGADYAYIDNIVLTPEPATLGLLALGGLALLRRRR